MSLINSLRHLKSRVVTKKSIALFFINKRWPQQFGRLQDFAVDNKKSEITLQLQMQDAPQQLVVKDYQVSLQDQQTLISWKKLSVSGSCKAQLMRSLPSHSSVQLPASYYALVSRLLVTQEN